MAGCDLLGETKETRSSVTSPSSVLSPGISGKSLPSLNRQAEMPGGGDTDGMLTRSLAKCCGDGGTSLLDDAGRDLVTNDNVKLSGVAGFSLQLGSTRWPEGASSNAIESEPGGSAF